MTFHSRNATVQTFFLVIGLVFLGLFGTAQAGIRAFPYPGYDAPGNDLDSFPSENVAWCSQSCLDRPDCSASEYDTRLKRCWLKNRAPSVVPATFGTLILKIVDAQDRIDYPGGDRLASE